MLIQIRNFVVIFTIQDFDVQKIVYSYFQVSELAFLHFLARKQFDYNNQLLVFHKIEKFTIRPSLTTKEVSPSRKSPHREKRLSAWPSLKPTVSRSVRSRSFPSSPSDRHCLGSPVIAFYNSPILLSSCRPILRFSFLQVQLFRHSHFWFLFRSKAQTFVLKIYQMDSFIY